MSENFTRADLKKVLLQYGLTATESAGFVDSFFDTLFESLLEGKNIKLLGFGTLNVLNKKERLGRDIYNNKPVVIPERRAVTFRSSKHLKNVLNNKG